MAKLKNWKCYEFQVNNIKIAEGQLIYTIDTGKVFFDIDSKIRIQLNSIYKITNSEMATINPITNGIYYITDTEMFYFYDGSNWIKFGGPFTGSQTTESSADGGSNVYTFSDGSTITVKNGSKGSTGAKGTSAAWFTGTAVTGTSTKATTFTVSGSKAGDMYLNTSTLNVYRAANANSWVYVCNIKGATGATGTRGSVINQGTAITGTSTTSTVFSGSGLTSALVNDLYMNTSTFNIYRCTVAGNAATAKWVYVGCIKGVKGDTGDKGEKGDTGAQGPKGDNGDLIHIGSTFASSTQKKIFFRTV